MGQSVLHAAGEPVGRSGGLFTRGIDGPLSGLHDAVALNGGDLHHLAAQGAGQLFGIQPVAVFADDIHHIHGRYHRNAQLHQLGGQVQVPLQVGAVDDVQNDVGPLLY